MKTYVVRESDITRQWYVVDAQGQTLGRLASRIATILRGKHKPVFDPSVDAGDFVIVINAEKIRVTGRKMDQKIYWHHSGYPGGIIGISLRDQLRKHPDRVIQSAVWGMLPHNRLGRQIFKKLKVYAGPDHPHQAQQPKTLVLK